MKSIEWIEKGKSKLKIRTYTELAEKLGMTSASMAQHKSGRSKTLDDEAAYKLEALLGLPHGTIIADQAAERQSSPEIKRFWHHMGKLAAAAARPEVVDAARTNSLALFGIFVTYQVVISDFVRDHCILCSIDYRRITAKLRFKIHGPLQHGF